jgi:hypothetical protein
MKELLLSVAAAPSNGQLISYNQGRPKINEKLAKMNSMKFDQLPR